MFSQVFPSFLINSPVIHTETRAVHLPQCVGHASFVSQEGSQMDWATGVVFRPRAHSSPVLLAALVRQEAHVSMTRGMEFAMGLKKTSTTKNTCGRLISRQHMALTTFILSKTYYLCHLSVLDLNTFETCLQFDFCRTLSKYQISWSNNPDISIKAVDVSMWSSQTNPTHMQCKRQRHCKITYHWNQYVWLKGEKKQHWPCLPDRHTKGKKERGTSTALSIIHKMIQRVKTLNWCLAQWRRQIRFQTRQSLPSSTERIKSKVSDRQEAKKKGESKNKGSVST